MMVRTVAILVMNWRSGRDRDAVTMDLDGSTRERGGRRDERVMMVGGGG